jgi:biopolymer transport protein TolR
MAFQSSGGGALNEINITPLVDVMLVLLVVFMVTTPIIAEEMVQRKVEIDLPTTNAKPIQKSDMKTLVVLYPDYRVMLDLGEGPSLLAGCPPTPKDPNQQRKCLDDIKPKLEKNPKLTPDMTIFFLADRSLPYGFAVDVMSRIKEAGYTKLGMVTNPPQGQGG